MAVLQRPRVAPKIDTGFLENIRLIFAAAEDVEILETVAACRDPKDGMFLDLAVHGNADAITSGDSDLLAMTSFRGIPIVEPAVFVRSRIS